MKKIVLLLSVVAVLGSCTKVLDKLTTFSFTRDTEFTIPSSTILGTPLTLSTGDVQTSYVSEFENNGASVDNIDYIKLTAMSLEILSPANGNFNFLKDISIKISADGLGDKSIAFKMNVQNENVQKIDIDVTGEDLKPYLTKDKFSMVVDVTTDEIVSQDTKVKSEATFEAKANLK